MPTAAQNDGPEQQTASKEAIDDAAVPIEDGTATASMCQPEPSRRSANGASRALTPSWPTAMQDRAAVHETAASGRPRAGAAGGTSAQRAPSQCAMRLAEPLVRCPTAMQSSALTQLTEPRTRGAGVTLQRRPSQRSPSGWSGCPLAAVEISPTTMHALADAHESAARFQRFPGLARPTIVQRPSWRCSATDPNGTLVPIARQSPAAPQETPSSSATRDGLGTGCVLQPAVAASAGTAVAASTIAVLRSRPPRRRAPMADIVGSRTAGGATHPARWPTMGPLSRRVTSVDLDLLERYASLAVRVGVNLQPGQDLYVHADLEHTEVARAVVEEAYRAGAHRVEVLYEDPVARRSTLIHAPLETLRSVPGWRFEMLAEIERTGAALIRLTGSSDPTLFEGIDGERVAALPIEYAEASRKVLLGGGVAWNIIAAPNRGWATQIFGEPDLERLWDALRVAMRLDGTDPVAAWQEQRETLGRRAQALNALEIDQIRFRGEGTDLSVGLLAQAVWTSGSFRTHAGVEFMPNLPTEEVFTSPDRRRAEGVARLTRPLLMPRARVLVEGLELRLEHGRIVEARADRGGDAIAAELDTDEGARSLGEVALVDSTSRIRDAGVVFHNTLYDENAGSHIAWGQSLPTAIDAGTERDPDELFELGLNRSAVHTDVVIGGPGIDVDALTASGERIAVIRDDAWVLETAAP